MIILEEHFRGRSTYIIGEYIINGCQSFKIDELDEVCKEFRVSYEVKQDVIEAYNKNILIEEDLVSLCNHGDTIVRRLVAKHNIPELLVILKDDEHNLVREQALDTLKRFK